MFIDKKEPQLRPDKDVHDYPIGDELVLFSKRSGALYRANTTAALIWQGIRAGLERKEILALLAEAFHLAEDIIAADIETLLTQWRSNGLIEGGAVAIQGPCSDPQPYEKYSKPLPPPNIKHILTRYILLDSRIVLKLPGKEEAFLVHPLLDHLNAPQLTECNLELEVRKSTDHYVLLRDGTPVDWCDDKQGLAPLVHGNMLVLAYELSESLTGLHAAAVATDAHCILMPALSGSGKSTLAAALVGRGFQYGSDDMVLLTTAPVKMRPAPVSMGLKNGSWKVLERYYPHLVSLPVHLRYDQQNIRYLPPPNDLIVDPTTRLNITHIVFPSYRSGSNATLQAISQAEGLCRIAEAGYDVHGGLSAGRVRQLVDWIAKIPCYEFHYSHLEEAVGALKIFLRES